MNKRILPFLALPPLFFFLLPSQAVTVFQCKDASGRISFQDRCPPGTTRVGEKTYASRKSTDDVGSFSGPVTLYRIPDCGGCEQVKEFMAARGIAVTEKDVNDNVDNQGELQDKTGELRVPTVIIGDKAITGYNRNSLISALSEAGYRSSDQQEGGGEN